MTILTFPTSSVATAPAPSYAADVYEGAVPALLTADEVRLATYQDEVGRARFRRYEMFRDYYDGRQRDPRTLTFTDDDLTRDRTFSARHNVCASIVDILVERLTVKGFGATVGDERADVASEIAKLLWRWWSLNRMDAYGRVAHHHAISLGDGYVMVEWDRERGLPRYHIEDPFQIRAVYNARHELEVVYKAWEEVTDITQGARVRLRINKYRPGLCEKFVMDPGGTGLTYWTGDLDSSGQYDGGIIPWVDRDGVSLPIPIVHFRNLNRGSDVGRSELSDALSMQDEYNRRVWSTGQATIFDGARIKYGINIERMVDASGQERTPPIGPNAFWYIDPADPDKPASLATLEAGDLGQLQEVADRELKTIAGLLGIPIHLIWPAGGLPSGESLKTAEARLVSKLQDRTVTFGNAWEDVCTIALRLGQAFGALAVPDDLQLTAEWASVETRSALQDEQVIGLRAADLSWRQRMRERAYSEDEIATIESEREIEAPAPVTPTAPVADAAAVNLANAETTDVADATALMRRAAAPGGE